LIRSHSSQQYSNEPALPATPGLQVSDESSSDGVSDPVHEKPKEAPEQPVTVGSCEHVADEANETQQ
jgi:hypothetical protein